MNASLSIIILVVISFYSNAQEFHLKDSLFARAKTENKKVPFYFSESDWCAPCIRLKKTYLEKADGKLFIKKFNVIDLRFNYYERNNGFNAYSITFGLNF